MRCAVSCCCLEVGMNARFLVVVIGVGIVGVVIVYEFGWYGIVV